jgi:curved DNA-binding protein CbpA
MNKDLYQTLEIHPGASTEEIKKAFRRVALNCHPDRTFQNREAEERFKEANHAYSILGDDEKRKRYDLYRRVRSSSAHLGFAFPPSPVYDKILEDFFLNASIPGMAAGIPWNVETLVRLHPLLSASWNALGFLRRLYQGLRTEDFFDSSSGAAFFSAPVFRKKQGNDRPKRGRFASAHRRETGFRPPSPSSQPEEAQAVPSTSDSSGDREWLLPLTSEEAEHGTVLMLSLPSGRVWERVRVRVPAGVRNGLRLRIRNKGDQSRGGKIDRGDLYLRIRIN